VWGTTVLSDGRILSWAGGGGRSSDNTLRLWNGSTGASLATLEGHTDTVIDATVLPDGRILSRSRDKTLRLWDGTTGEPLATLEGHTDAVKGATVLPDGRILSWSHDNTLRLWDGNTGEPLATLEGHTRSVEGATILPDGRILSWAWDNTLRLWDANTGAALSQFNRNTVEYDAPDIHRAWREYYARNTVHEDVRSAGRAGGADMTVLKAAISWHADGGWRARALTANGSLVATCAKHVEFLQLHHGNRRVTLDEAKALLSSSSSRPGQET